MSGFTTLSTGPSRRLLTPGQALDITVRARSHYRSTLRRSAEFMAVALVGVGAHALFGSTSDQGMATAFDWAMLGGSLLGLFGVWSATWCLLNLALVRVNARHNRRLIATDVERGRLVLGTGHWINF